MNKRFILLIDFSETSNSLIRYAVDWSKQANAEILLVHQTSVFAPALADNESKLRIIHQTNNDALQALKALSNELIPKSIKVSYNVSESHLQITLCKILEKPFDNLIFTGLKGTGLLKKIFLGSVALQIIDNTNNNIVAIPKDITTFSHEKIFVAITEKHPLNILELNNFLKFVDKQNTNIIFFHLAKPNEKTLGIEKQLRELSELFADRFKTEYVIYEGNRPFDDVKKVINNNVEEILIVQKGSRFLTDQLFRKFLINELVYEGQTPLIVLP